MLRGYARSGAALADVSLGPEALEAAMAPEGEGLLVERRRLPRGGQRSLVVSAVCIFTLLGHICAPGNPGDHAVRQLEAAMAPEGLAHETSCEVLPGSSGVPSGALVVGMPILAGAIPPVAPGHAPDAPAPVPRPPRFILHAALLN
jgi:hypothetical protein